MHRAKKILKRWANGFVSFTSAYAKALGGTAPARLVAGGLSREALLYNGNGGKQRASLCQFQSPQSDMFSFSKMLRRTKVLETSRETITRAWDWQLLIVQARQRTTAPSMWSRKLAQQVQSSLLLVSIWTSIIPSIVQSCIRTARLAELLFYSGDTRRYVRQSNGAEAATNFCR